MDREKMRTADLKQPGIKSNNTLEKRRNITDEWN
jgi:hypothetical protein